MSTMDKHCIYCTFLNPPNVQICGMCSKSVDSIVASSLDEEWNGIQCDKCTYLNSSDDEICNVCRLPLYIVSSEDVQFEEIPRIEELVDKTDQMHIEGPRHECEICCEAIGFNYFAMFECVHIFCNACAVGYFTNQITQRPILDCICPMCDLPDLHTNTDKHEQYFSLLLACLTPILDENIINVFEKKLTELALSSDPNFVWCIQCTSGFVKHLPTATVTNMIRCPDCRVRFCFECKKVWESQHQGITCEQFAKWQRDNNVEVSHDAIGNYLKKNGIDCPKCKFKYDLSRGGCIHFTCTQCKHEFCFGCSTPFLRSCTVSPYCKNVGLHAHHKRNCFYYLRDKSVAQLQGLIEANGIKFTVELPERLTNIKTNDSNNCPIELQVEALNGIVDTICREPTEGGQAGLCKKHYKEYLILTITKANLETNSILNVHNYHELLRFQGIAIPRQTTDQKDDEYKKICEMLVKNNIPLQ